MRRIIGKAVMKIAKYDLQEAVRATQLCAGQEAGCEAAVHAMEWIFDDEDTETIIQRMHLTACTVTHSH